MFKRNPQVIVHLNSETGIPPIPIFEKKFTVGRKPTHLVAIPDNSISRDHLEVIIQDAQIFVVDLGTSNGTTLDGQKIPSHIPSPYKEGQILTLGHSNVSLSIELFHEDREKRRNNPSAKAMQQFKGYSSAPQPAPVAVQPTHQQISSSHYEPREQNYQQPNVVNFTPPVQQSTQQPFPQTAQPSIVGNVAPAPTPYPSASAQPTFPQQPEALGVVTQQTREDANRILAKAKIDAEMAARDLMRSKENEAQQIIQQAEKRALEKIKDAESQVQVIIQQANLEADKIKETLLTDAHRDKERILASINHDKELVQRDIESLKQSIPSLTAQVDHLKLDIQKHQTEKISVEAQHTQETIRLEKLLAEMRTHDLQLKNIQQQLELNQIKANDAEEKYKTTVIANQTLVDETKAALERAKLREAELATLIEGAKAERDNALEFAKAQRSEAEGYAAGHRADAEAYSKVMREEADAHSKVMREEADAYSKVTREETDRWAKAQQEETTRSVTALRDETERWVSTTREATELDVRKKIEALNQETTQIIAERDRTYQEMKQRQETILDELKNTESMKMKNLQDIDDILKRKSDEFEMAFRARREGLEAEYQKRKEQIDQEFSDKRDGLERELSDRRTSIERELLQRREDLERESAEKKAEIEREAQELRATRDKEYKSMKTQQDAYLMDIKRREEDRLRAMVEDSRRIIKEQFASKNEYIQKTLSEFLTNYGNSASSVLKEHLPTLKQDLEKILKEALTNELTGEDKQIQQLLEYDPNIEKKHKKFWVRFAWASGFVVAGLSYLLYNPNKLSEGVQTITESVNNIDLENKKKSAALLEKMKQAAIYRPEQDLQFKETYTDNVLYTSRYVEFEKDDQYRSQWIVAIKEFLLQEAKLIDDKADELISKEGSLVIWLDSEVATIDGRNPEKGISRMREKENEYTQMLTQTLNDETRRAFKEKKQAFYERYINDSSKNRGPAQSGQ